jgi:hypothetical protein
MASRSSEIRRSDPLPQFWVSFAEIWTIRWFNLAWKFSIKLVKKPQSADEEFGIDTKVQKVEILVIIRSMFLDFWVTVNENWTNYNFETRQWVPLG